jgi:hypothetical protein
MIFVARHCRFGMLPALDKQYYTVQYCFKTPGGAM